MYSKQSHTNSHNKCQECHLFFETPTELLNHKQKFCINSGYDNLQGLIHLQYKGINPTSKPSFSNKTYLQQYGSNSLTKVHDLGAESRQIDAFALEKDMKKINKFKRQLQGVKKYHHNDQIQQSSAYNIKETKSKTTIALQNSYINELTESRLNEDLKKYQKTQKESAISPPTFIDQLAMKNHTVLDKSNSSLGKMQNKDKLEYAMIKLDELNEIKDLYIENGGRKEEFKGNIQRMRQFYMGLIKKLKEEAMERDNDSRDGSMQLIDSRLSTPILKLRNLNDKNKQNSANKLKDLNASNIQKNSQTLIASPQQNNSNQKHPSYPQYPQGMQYPYYPNMMMMPYPPMPYHYQQQNSYQSQNQNQSQNKDDNYRLLERMVQLKSQENQKLLQILLEDKKKNNMQPQSYMYPYGNNQYPTMMNQQPSQLPLNSINNPMNPYTHNSQQKQSKEAPFKKKNQIDQTQSYQFKKQMIQDLISQQKVLLALQQQELDELKLLSQLPKELQELKMKSVIKASDTRFQVEKELLKQKLQRLNYQEQNQAFQEGRKINNDRWAGEERKKLMERQMNKYVDNFQEKYNNGLQ